MNGTVVSIEFMLLPNLYNFSSRCFCFDIVVDAWYCGLIEFTLLPNLCNFISRCFCFDIVVDAWYCGLIEFTLLPNLYNFISRCFCFDIVVDAWYCCFNMNSKRPQYHASPTISKQITSRAEVIDVWVATWTLRYQSIMHQQLYENMVHRELKL